MTVAEQKAILDAILQNHTDQAFVSEQLAMLGDDYSKVNSTLETATQTAETLTAENEKIRKANFKLFEQLGEQPKPSQQTPTPEDNTPSFESLFDANGNLI